MLLKQSTIESIVKSIITVDDSDNFKLSEKDNLKAMKKYMKKDFWNVWNICPSFDKVCHDTNSVLIAIESAEIFSNPYIDDDYLFVGSGKMDINFVALFESYQDGKCYIHRVCFSMIQAFQTSWDEYLFNQKNCGIINQYKEI